MSHDMWEAMAAALEEKRATRFVLYPKNVAEGISTDDPADYQAPYIVLDEDELEGE